jgi:hypothetical protein
MDEQVYGVDDIDRGKTFPSPTLFTINSTQPGLETEPRPPGWEAGD